MQTYINFLTAKNIGRQNKSICGKVAETQYHRLIHKAVLLAREFAR
jgi:hypothetical protein